MMYLIFYTEQDAIDFRSGIDAILGYPISGGHTKHAVNYITNGEQWALGICDVAGTQNANEGYTQRMVNIQTELLTSSEQSSLKDKTYLEANGWFDDT